MGGDGEQRADHRQPDGHRPQSGLPEPDERQALAEPVLLASEAGGHRGVQRVDTGEQEEQQQWVLEAHQRQRSDGPILAEGVQADPDVGCGNPQRCEIPAPWRWFLFNNTAVKRSAIKKTGLFDEKFTSYGGEDTDMAIRLWHNFPDALRFSSKISAEHHHKRTLNQFCKQMEMYGQTNLPLLLDRRSEERRVGKECRSRGSPYH